MLRPVLSLTPRPMPDKPEKEITTEVQAIMRQVSCRHARHPALNTHRRAHLFDSHQRVEARPYRPPARTLARNIRVNTQHGPP